MKDLVEYIKESYEGSFDRILNDALYEHLLIDSDLLCVKHLTFESRSEVNGSDEAAQKAYDMFIEEPFKERRIFVSNELGYAKITYIENKQNGSIAFSYESDRDSKDIGIECMTPLNPDEDTFKRLFKHELVHALQDMKLQKKLDVTLKELSTSEYANASKFASQKNIIGELAKALYLLCDEEQNAYMSSLYDDVRRIMKKNNWNSYNVDINKLTDELVETDMWKEYIAAGKLITDFKYGKLNADEENALLKAYQTLSSNKCTVHILYNDYKMEKHFWGEQYDEHITIGQLKAYLWNQWTKFSKKLHKRIPRMCAESIGEYHGFVCKASFD